MWPFDNNSGLGQGLAANPTYITDQMLGVGPSDPYAGLLTGTPAPSQYQPMPGPHMVSTPINPTGYPTPAGFGYPFENLDVRAVNHMKELALNSENTLILELTKMMADVTDESFRKVILGRIENAEGRKLAVELADLNQ